MSTVLVSIKFGYTYFILIIITQSIPFVSCYPGFCLQEYDPGRCFALTSRWYFEPHTSECLPFSYGGCGGNRNNFRSKVDCRRQCQVLSIDGLRTKIQKLKDQDICEQKMEQGDCRGYFPKWFYEHATQTCKQFIYSGCGGTGNNFETNSLCLKKCGQHSHSRLKLMPPKKQQANFQLDYHSQFYDEKELAGQLQFFSQNQGAAKLICSLGPIRGLCKANIPRWFYNWQTTSCQQFIYGGCRGNQNNFDTEEECAEMCG